MRADRRVESGDRALVLTAQPRVVQRLPDRDPDRPDRRAARRVAGASSTAMLSDSRNRPRT